MSKLNKGVIEMIVILSLACAECASNQDVAGQVLSGVLMGIGTGLSGL